MCDGFNAGNGNAVRDLLKIAATWLLCFGAAEIGGAALYALYPDVACDPMALRCVTGVREVVILILPALLLDKMLQGAAGGRFIPSLTRVLPLRVLLSGVLAVLTLVPVVSSLSSLNHLLLPQAGWLHDVAASQDAAVNAYYALVMTSVNPADWVANIIVVTILAGVGEELFFRGILQRFAVRCGMRGWAAVLVVAVFFSLVHLQLSEFLPRVAMGIVLGYAYLVSGHIWLPVVMHVANNVVALVSYNCGLSFQTQWLMGLVAAGILAAVLVRRGHKE